jgi:hypothetical protein
MIQDVLRGELVVPDLILMVLGPPLFGCAVGRRTREKETGAKSNQ